MSKTLERLRLGLIAIIATAAHAQAGEIVVVMGTDATPLTKEQVASVYLGRNNRLKPVDLPETNPVCGAFYRKVTDRELAQIKALWSRLSFTGQGQPPRQLTDAASVKKAVAADPSAIGYIDRADLDASVKVVLALD